MSNRLKDDEDFILELIKSFGGGMLLYASKRIRNNKVNIC